MKITVDQNLCIGCGACAGACPEVFEIKEDGKSHVVGNPDESDCDFNDVAAACPVGAIKIEE